MRVAFVHPDLGIGGAERLIVDAAYALSEQGHDTTVYTAYHDASRSFTELLDGSVKYFVVRPLLLPRAVCNRLQALLAALRCMLVAFYVCLFHPPHAAVVDLVSLPLLVFALFRVPTVFYCHFPDKLLAGSLTQTTAPAAPGSRLKKFYRLLIDHMELFALRHASVICCNSKFTVAAFRSVYPNLKKPVIIYPCIHIHNNNNTSNSDSDRNSNSNTKSDTNNSETPQNTPQSKPVTDAPYFISLNRYEGKKNIPLAIKSFSEFLHNNTSHTTGNINLIIAGGYDDRIQENQKVYAQLEQLSRELKLSSNIQLMKNIDEHQRQQLLSNAVACIYTPSNEHFGIVPLEAMALATPVIACNSGGPCESILHNVTGILCDANEHEFANAMSKVYEKFIKGDCEMGDNGKHRVVTHFSRNVMGTHFDDVLQQIVAHNKNQ